MPLISCTFRRSRLPRAAALLRPFTLACLLLGAAVASPHALAEKKLRVVTTFTIIQDIAQNVAGDAAVVESITKPGAEIHDYQPTPRDIVKAQHADLILWNGMNSNAGSSASSRISSRCRRRS